MGQTGQSFPCRLKHVFRRTCFTLHLPNLPFSNHRGFLCPSVPKGVTPQPDMPFSMGQSSVPSVPSVPNSYTLFVHTPVYLYTFIASLPAVVAEIFSSVRQPPAIYVVHDPGDFETVTTSQIRLTLPKAFAPNLQYADFLPANRSLNHVRTR